MLHSYYGKPMKTQYTVLQRSTMSEHQRVAIFSNELVRRLSTIHRDVLDEEMEGVIEKYIAQLKTSEYGHSDMWGTWM